MYSSRKKIVLVSAASCLTLGIFAVGSWAIIDSGNRNPRGDAFATSIANATTSLGEHGDGALQIDEMSVQSWIQYNMPSKLVVQETSASDFTVSYYNYKSANMKTLTELESADNQYNLIAKVKYHITESNYNVDVYLSDRYTGGSISSSHVTFGTNGAITMKNVNARGVETTTNFSGTNEKSTGKLGNYSIDYTATKGNGSTQKTETKLEVKTDSSSGTTSVYSWSYNQTGSFVALNNQSKPATNAEGETNTNKYLESYSIIEKGIGSNSMTSIYNLDRDNSQEKKIIYNVTYNNGSSALNPNNQTQVTQFRNAYKNNTNQATISLPLNINMLGFFKGIDQSNNK
ncbi:hypothetical protein [Malacoplasma iowae]|uniref:hypothetical protein n=1 Tax=Malacoplasma iowae TaxID=2116 RepID=UPI002A186FB1|nr:hypothetical protein [Malacoplasma iowae]WPL39527.1 hypothetical protein QX183_03180 [Malacoplasma iowae]